jgi:hypothetical protein
MFLIEWLWDVLKELRRLYMDNLSSGGPSGRMEKQLRIMYGRGEIDRATFLKLRNSIEKGYYIEGELKMYHRQAIARLELEGKYLEHHFNDDISRGLDSLYLNRAVLEEVRLEMNQALKVIEQTRAWLQEQVEAAHANAQSALPDEKTARALLEIRQDLLERIQFLDSRSKIIQQNIHQIDLLEAELGVYEAELMLAESQEHYASARLALHR